MSEEKPTRVHVTFGASAAGSLTTALGTLGRAERVLFLADDLSFGPIDPPDAGHRMEWCTENLGFEVDPEIELVISAADRT